MKKLRTALVLAAAVFAFLDPLPRAAGAINTMLKWEFAGWCGGGAYPGVVLDGNVYGRVYLISDVSGVWRSDTRGGVWMFRNQGLTTLHVVALAVAKSNSNVLYIGTKTGMLRSDDAGMTWRYLASTKDKVLFRRPDNYRSIAIDKLDHNKVYAGTKDGQVWFTNDGGESFARLGAAPNPFGQPTPISALHLTRDGRWLFAGSTFGLIRYDLSAGPAGAWMRLDVAKGTRVLDMVSYLWKETLFITAEKRVGWSSDNGATWQYSEPIPSSSETAHVNRISVRSDRAGTTKLLAAWRDGWGGGVYLSPDTGKTWKDIEKNLSHDVLLNPTRVWAQGFGWPLSVSFDPFEANTLYFTDFWGVWRSDDNGESWVERIKGAANTVGSDITVAPDGAILVATMDNGLMKSSDGGVSYKSLCPVDTVDNSVKGHVWRVIAAGPLGKHVVATSSPWDVTSNQVLISEDGGVAFKKTRTGLPLTYPKVNTVWDKGYARALAVDPSDPKRFYLGIDGDDGGGFFFSTDGGYSWTRPDGQPGSLRVYNGLAVDPANPNRIYWGTAGTSANGGIYRSENRGLTWTKVFSATGWVFDLAVSSDGKVYAATDSGGPAVYFSSDFGANWTLLKQFEGTGSCEAITIDPNNPERVAVTAVKWDGSTGGRIFLSEDAGRSWNDITSDLPNGAGAAAMAFSRDGAHLYISRYAGSVYRIKLKN